MWNDYGVARSGFLAAQEDIEREANFYYAVEEPRLREEEDRRLEEEEERARVEEERRQAEELERQRLEELDREPLRLAAVDWAPNDREGDKLLFVFDCGPLGEDEQRIKLDGQELDRWEWVAADELGDYLIPRLARPIGSVLKGDAPGGAYFEHGVPFPGSALV